jgi:hypothetical protein
MTRATTIAQVGTAHTPSRLAANKSPNKEPTVTEIATKKPRAPKKAKVAQSTELANVTPAYKGFGPDMKCRNFQYAIGETYTTARSALCDTGFHACEYPLDVFRYYPPGTSVFAEVDLHGDVKKSDDKACATGITIKASLSLPGIIKAAIDFTFARSRPEGETATGNQGAASSTGNQGAASSTGDQGAASSTGDRGAASSTGNRGAASSTGNQGAASSTGNQGAASSTGYRGAASSTGNRGAASSTGKESVACALGYNSKALAGAAGVIVVAWWDVEAERKRVTIGYPGQDGIKADTWYRCDEAGKLVEAA